MDCTTSGEREREREREIQILNRTLPNEISIFHSPVRSYDRVVASTLCIRRC
jgi:hypothetical protein